MQEHPENTAAMDANPPEKGSRSGNMFFVLILACWLLLLYFYGGAKGPG